MKPTRAVRETLLIVATVILAIGSIGLFIASQKQALLKQEATFNLNMLRATFERLQNDAQGKEKLRTKLEEKLDELTKMRASLEVQIAQIEKICDASQEQIFTIESNTTSSQSKIKNILAEKNALLERITSGEHQIETLQSRLAVLEETTAALDRHLKKSIRLTGASQIKRDIQEPEIIEPEIMETPKPDQSAIISEPGEVSATSQGQAHLKGEVLVVNREFNFIVINLGKQDGLKEGDSVCIYDGDKMLGEVFIETVRENISAASGGSTLNMRNIRPGNEVIK